MRWDNLFDDLESQLEQELTAEDVDLRAEEERLRLGRLSVRDRIVSLHRASGEFSSAIRIFLGNGEALVARPTAFGRDWFAADLVGDGARHQQQCIVPISAIAGLTLERTQIAQSLNGIPGENDRASLNSRLSLAFVLRDLCRRRSSIELLTTLGSLRGTIDRVGRDHLDVAIHEYGSPRRESEVTQTRIVPLSQVWLVRI